MTEHGATLAEMAAHKHRLTHRQRAVLELRHGLTDECPQPYSLVETARILRITRERVRILERKALERVRHLVEMAREDPGEHE